MRASLMRWSRRVCLNSRKNACTSKTPLTTIEGYHESSDTWPHDDYRWPTKCAECGRDFLDSDHWRLVHDRLFLWENEGVEITLDEAQPGAMWDARSYVSKSFYPGPDGMFLYVRLPNGNDWFIDGPSKESKDRTIHAWSRTGNVPNVSVTPGVISTNNKGLVTRHWEGKLIDGLLIRQSLSKGR